ncbi:hypothetical protein [Caenimonas sp. SL110]|uniref:hypothetical protein n=1 Tax=Caenimonas sp. SL110 TaxID=1450524 RepID=UPI00128C4F48|nr:hypothetical protein [Caenimonas sp. SL110]
MPASDGAKPVMADIRESLSQWAHDEHANPDELNLRIYLADDIARSIEEALPSQGDDWLRSSVQIDIPLPDLSRFKIDVHFARPEPEPAEVPQAEPGVVRLADVPRVSSRSAIYIQNRIASMTVLSKLLGPDNPAQRSRKNAQEIADIMGPYRKRVENQTHGLVVLIEQLPDENERLQLLFQLTSRLNSLGVRCFGGHLEHPAMVAVGESMDEHVLPAVQRLGDMQLEAASNLQRRLLGALEFPVLFYRQSL